MRPIRAFVIFGLLVTVSACSGGDKDAFRNVDHDKNGEISYEEVLFVFPEITPELYAQIDTDGDGGLSEKEYAIFLKSAEAKTAKSAGQTAQSPTDTEPSSATESPRQAAPGQQIAVPYKGEEVIEIPAPGTEQTAKAKAEKSKKESKSKAEPTKKGEATQYTVVRGDNLSRIARRFGVTVEDITRANGNMPPDTLRDGQVITIPARP